jgi:hypothetical protein
MDQAKRNRLFADILAEAVEDVNRQGESKRQETPTVHCGCVDKCGDVSKHDENTVLEGIVLDPENRLYEDSMLQDHIQFAGWRAKFADL